MGELGIMWAVYQNDIQFIKLGYIHNKQKWRGKENFPGMYVCSGILSRTSCGRLALFQDQGSENVAVSPEVADPLLKTFSSSWRISVERVAELSFCAGAQNGLHFWKLLFTFLSVYLQKRLCLLDSHHRSCNIYLFKKKRYTLSLQIILLRFALTTTPQEAAWQRAENTQ